MNALLHSRELLSRATDAACLLISRTNRHTCLLLFGLDCVYQLLSPLPLLVSHLLHSAAKGKWADE